MENSEDKDKEGYQIPTNDHPGQANQQEGREIVDGALQEDQLERIKNNASEDDDATKIGSPPAPDKEFAQEE